MEKDKGKWEAGYETLGGFNLLSEYMMLEGFDPKHWADFEIMQFTGLKDQNGKEIYDGDIVRIMVANSFGSFEPHIGFLKWNDRWAGFEGDVESTRIKDLEINAPDEPLEVLGNIYENPELLKQYGLRPTQAMVA